MSEKIKMKTGCATTSGIDRGPKAQTALPHARNLFGEAPDPHDALRGLKREFTFPPFTVFNAREGSWQARKRMWLRLGIQSELGRGEDLLNQGGKTEEQWNADQSASHAKSTKYNPSKGKSFNDARSGLTLLARTGPVGKDLDYYRNKGKKMATASPYSNPKLRGLDLYRNKEKRERNGAEVFGTHGNISTMTGVSVFDPVLCELMYRWFCPPGGTILDPFAGGSVRGITASALGRKYFGVDLSARQITANREQAERICTTAMPAPQWFSGDSTRIKKLVPAGFTADMLFSCPPYADLEVYSNDAADISNMPYLAFVEAYRKIIRRSVSLLKPNAFAAWVVSEVRNTTVKSGAYRGLVQETILAFIDAGMEYYNEAILVTAVGSLPLRTRKAFLAARKMGRTHQTVLIFCKGAPRKAAFPL